MKTRSWQRGFSLFATLFASLLLGACGGGGGGDSSSPVSFNGSTTQAAVTPSNAKSLSVDAYQGGMSGSTLGVLGKEAGVDNPTTAARCTSLAATLEGAVKQAVSARTSRLAKTVDATAQETINGPYGGTASFTINVDENSGAFSGTLTFSAFKGLQDSSVTGSVSFSGIFNSSSSSFPSINISFSALMMVAGGNSYTAAGNISLSMSGSTENMIISLVLKDGVTGKTYWVKDYAFSLTAGSPQTLTITGTYYDHDYGYVTISTLTPLQVTSLNAWPTAGVLLFSGSGGSKALLTFTTSGYIVEVDTNGDGGFITVP